MKPYALGIDVTALNEKQLHEVKKILSEYNPEFLTEYPAQYGVEMGKWMSTHGYPKLGQFPVILTQEQAHVLSAKTIKRFNPGCILKREPSSALVIKKVHTEQDFARIVDDMLATLDSESLCHIFNTNSRKSEIVVFTQQNPANSKLAKNILQLNSSNYNKGEEIRQLIQETIDQISLDNRVNKFQYR